MADNRHIEERYAEIGQRLIETMDELAQLRESDVSIVYLGSDDARKKNGKLTLGQCEKVGDKWKWSVPADFTITVFEPNVEEFNDRQLEALIFHELLHVGVEDDEHDHLYVRPHDTEDFSAVIKRYGVDWAKTEGDEPLPFER